MSGQIQLRLLADQFYLGDTREALTYAKRLAVLPGTSPLAATRDILTGRAIAASGSPVPQELVGQYPILGALGNPNVVPGPESTQPLKTAERLLAATLAASRQSSPEAAWELLAPFAENPGTSSEDGGLATAEAAALAVVLLLRLGQVESARATLAEVKVQAHADDLSLSDSEETIIRQLAEIWVTLVARAPPSVESQRSAFFTLRELTERFQATPKLLCAQATVHLVQGNLRDAEHLLLESQKLDPTNEVTLANLFVVASHLGRPQATLDEYLKTLSEVAPKNPLLGGLMTFPATGPGVPTITESQVTTFDQLFDQAAARISG
ncbi:hypothetical protein H696_01167 [Fonticula alba]|uniref:Coatomer subunit epsilon n=1 Tax=Fonticula alba TaxID=691883 RepID=A0A058ZCT2_FONAL|nr:hypothetical protein H696_01167 [Fonticula alba]KCV71746.1 hypothetical protein H696_01167 [Fonticula alba]|eukprot:XP_009493324.1 hypothetical protein H696_01167 [Fonticula alba]